MLNSWLVITSPEAYLVLITEIKFFFSIRLITIQAVNNIDIFSRTVVFVQIILHLSVDFLTVIMLTK